MLRDEVTIKDKNRLSSARVLEVCEYAMLKDSEVTDNIRNHLLDPGIMCVDGVINTLYFKISRLEEKLEDIRELAAQLNEVLFIDSEGQGNSFLLIPDRGDGDVWCQHQIAESILCLMMGANIAKYLVSREMWSMFPASMPYVQINLNGYDEPNPSVKIG